MRPFRHLLLLVSFVALIPASGFATEDTDEDLDDIQVIGAPSEPAYPRAEELAAARVKRKALDTDSDGLIGELDLCPDTAGTAEFSGCPPLLLPDWDNDGLNVELCPDDAEDLDGFEDEDGCPEADNDWDGIVDALDACRNEPEDIDGFHDDDGCPDTDNDGDQIADMLDGCPDRAEDVDGFQDDDGCPDLDNDGEGIADAVDKCPNEREVINGYLDEDGCPDVLPSARLAGNRIHFDGGIQFLANTARIDDSSQLVLDEVARLIRRNPALQRIRIEGYTDSTGNKRKNRKLSLQRAQSVARYLVDRGVSKRLLETVGFGQRWAERSNKKASGRAENRRVEFWILETDRSAKR